MHVARIPAGAHILLAVVGFNYARFQLPRLRIADRRRRVREALEPIVRTGRRRRRRGSPPRCWCSAATVSPTLLLVNNLRRLARSMSRVAGGIWFFEVVVQLMLVLNCSDRRNDSVWWNTPRYGRILLCTAERAVT